MMSYIIGVCGPSCSGKTTTCKMIIDKANKTIQNLLNDKEENFVSVLSQDSYYKGGNRETNYDIPDAIDFKLMISHLRDLSRGKSINCPIYDFTTHTRKKDTIKIDPAPIIVVEGILIFFVEELRNLCNLKVYVEAIRELRYERRVTRDIKERGRDRKEVMERYFKHVLPSNEHYVEPTMNYTDIVLMNNRDNEFVGITILLDHIEKKISEQSLIFQYET